MNMIECPSCEKQLKETASFCSGCGSQVRCTSCKELISSGSNFCESCGIELRRSKGNPEAANTFEFNETTEGRSVKASFTDSAVKEMAQTMSSFVSSKQIAIESKVSNHTQKTSLIDLTVEEAKEIVSENHSSKVANGSSSLETVFRETGERLELLETRIKATSKADYTARLTYLIVLYFENKGEKVKKSTINALLEFCGLYDGNFRNWFGKQKNDFLVLDGLVELRPAGKQKAQKYLSDIFDDKVADQWGFGDLKSTGTKKVMESGSAKKVGKVAAKSVSQEEFDIAVKGKTLEQFYNENSLEDSTNHRILIIAYYIIKFAKLPSFSDGNIDYAYRVLRLNKRPTHLRQTIVNMKNKQVWIADGEPSGSWVLSRNGEIYVEEKLLGAK